MTPLSIDPSIFLDISYRKQSFDNLNEWYNEFKENTKEDVLVYMVGNRVDLEDKRQVSSELGEQY